MAVTMREFGGVRMAFRAVEMAFVDAVPVLPITQLMPKLRRVLEVASPLSLYLGTPALAFVVEDVGRRLFQEGLFVDALPLLREALAGHTTNLGAEHNATTLSRLNVGVTLLNLDQHVEALSLLQPALARLTQVHGAEHADTLLALNMLARVLLRARMAVRARVPVLLPPPGLVYRWAMMNKSLAEVFVEQGQLGEAERLLQSLLPTLAASPENIDSLLKVNVELGMVLQHQGNLLAAERLFRDLLPNLSGEPRYIIAHSLGVLLQERGLVTEARKYLDIARKENGKSYGAESASTKNSQRCRNGLDNLLRSCARCGPVADATLVMKVCSGCKAARYCSSECQRLDWRAHKLECRRIEAESVGEGPA